MAPPEATRGFLERASVPKEFVDGDAPVARLAVTPTLRIEPAGRRLPATDSPATGESRRQVQTPVEEAACVGVSPSKHVGRDVPDPHRPDLMEPAEET